MPVMYAHNSQTSHYAAFRERLDAERALNGLPLAETLEALRAYRNEISDMNDRATRAKRTCARMVYESEHSTLNAAQQFGYRPL